MDSDISHPYWNQIIRVLRNLPSIYSRVISHSNHSECRAELCLLCELALLFRKGSLFCTTKCSSLESLHVPSKSPIHISSFLRVIGLLYPEVLSQVCDTDHNPTMSKLRKSLITILEIVFNTDSVHNPRCKQCSQGSASAVYCPIVNVTRIQGSLTKSILFAIDSLSRRRLWCDGCQGYRDFHTEISNSHIPHVVLLDPLIWRSFPGIDNKVAGRKDEPDLFLKVSDTFSLL